MRMRLDLMTRSVALWRSRAAIARETLKNTTGKIAQNGVCNDVLRYFDVIHFYSLPPRYL